MVDMAFDDLDIDAARAQPRGRLWWLRPLAVIVALVLAAPFAATVVYRWAPPPMSMLMAIRAAAGAGIDYRWTALDRISPNLVTAVVASEDARLCQHRGVDWEVMRELLEEAGGPSRGGSTIAMQTAKNLFLWPARSYVRKAAELPLAHWIDFTWSKRRLVEVYLNIVEWGPGVYGAEAAAQRYFGKPASDLTRNEAALLAAALPNPIVRNAAKPGPAMRRQAARIARRMVSMAGHLDCLDL